MPDNSFVLPIAFDLAATFVFGLTGAVAAVRRGYDIVGLFALTFVTAAGGGLIRDAIFLRAGPPAVLQDSSYLFAVVLAGLAGWLIGDRIDRIASFYEVLDAVGLGVYAVVGAQKALATANMALAAAVLVGTVNACGGGLLRDILANEVPLLFKPGGFYALAAVVGASVFVVLVAHLGLGAIIAACVAIPAAFAVRILSLLLGWQTVPLRREKRNEEPGAPS
jgi:uncharacterized membrane protein YeiH